MNTKITDTSIETNELRLNNRKDFSWFKNVITQDDADEYDYSENYTEDDSDYENNIFHSDIITNLHDSDNYIAKEVRFYDVPEDLQELGFRIVTPYQWWRAESPSDFNPDLEETSFTTNLIRGFILLDAYGSPDTLNFASVGNGEVIVLPLNEGPVSDSGFFDGKHDTNTGHFFQQAEAYRTDLSNYLYTNIPALAVDTIQEQEQVSMLHGVEVTKIYFQVFYGDTAPIDDLDRLKEWEPLDFRYDGMTSGDRFEFDCRFIYDYNNGNTIWKGSNEDTFNFCLENEVSQNDFEVSISYDYRGIVINNVTWIYRPNNSGIIDPPVSNFGPVSFAIVGLEGSLLYPKFQISGSHNIATGENVQLELNKYSRSYKKISLIGRGFEPTSYIVDEDIDNECDYTSFNDDGVTLVFIDRDSNSEPGVCFNLWMYNDYELPKELAEGTEWQITLEAHSGEESKISVSSTLLPFNVWIPHILYNKNLYDSGYASLSNTIKDDKTYVKISNLFISNVATQDVDGDGIITSKDQIFAHDGSINTNETRLKNVKITRLKGGQEYDPDKE